MIARAILATLCVLLALHLVLMGLTLRTWATAMPAAMMFVLAVAVSKDWDG